MSATASIFEVRILIKSENPIRWHSWKDAVEYVKEFKTLHIERRTRKQAIAVAEKKGKVISCRKVDRDAVMGDMSLLPIQNERYMKTEHYANAITLDEFIWNKNKKRERIKNNWKDKKDIDI